MYIAHVRELVAQHSSELVGGGKPNPASKGVILEKAAGDAQLLDQEHTPYSQLVGALLYLQSCTRPDITQAVCVLARFMAAPTRAHWHAALRVLRYLTATASLGLVLGGPAPVGGGSLKASLRASAT
jgi:hypothetical protein